MWSYQDAENLTVEGNRAHAHRSSRRWPARHPGASKGRDRDACDTYPELKGKEGDWGKLFGTTELTFPIPAGRTVTWTFTGNRSGNTSTAEAVEGDGRITRLVLP